MAIRQAAKRRLTLDEFLALPETEPASELIDGEVVQKPVAKIPHSDAQTRMVVWLYTHPATRAGKTLAEQGTNLTEYDHRVPDVSWFAPGRLAGIRDYPSFAPDLAIEVRSEGQTKRAMRERLAFMRSSGARVTILVDPIDQTVEIHEGQMTWTARGADPVRIESIGGFEFVPAELFEP